MLILGLSGGFKRVEDDDDLAGANHDSAAALLHDGEVIAAIEEERLNRIKHTNCFPANAIRYCMEQSHVGWSDLDFIAIPKEEPGVAEYARARTLFNTAVPVSLDASTYIASLFMRDFGVNPHHKIRFCHHHEAHIRSAAAFSGFEESLALSIDGAGDELSGMVCEVRGHNITVLRKFTISQSLGLLYQNVIGLIGYSRFDEYKAMGLAPYGNPAVYKSLFEEGYKLLPMGDYSVDPHPVWLERFRAAGLLCGARRKGQPFSKQDKDLAAALQQLLQDIVMHVLRYYQSETGLRDLCLAGGVAHNCSLNGEILRSGCFDKMFVQPASHDAGLAVGACCSVLASELPGRRISPMRHVYYGADIETNVGLDERLRAWSHLVKIETMANPIQRTAALLSGGAVIGWVQGRAEFGPRALGNRSILADPRPASNKDLINSMVKKREAFRPFAPSVVSERAAEFFELPSCWADLSHMTYTLKVQEVWRSCLGAITHIDGTARVQTVTRDTNPLYWELLNEFGSITGVPILLNTSFNNDVEPIVDSIDDALECFLTIDINYLVCGKYLIHRLYPELPYEECLSLAVIIPSSMRLVRQKRVGCYTTSIESSKGNFNGKRCQEISPSTFAALSGCDDGMTVGDLLTSAGIHELECRKFTVRQLIELWSRRMIRLRPSLSA
jgi:carbamoyltransferase